MSPDIEEYVLARLTAVESSITTFCAALEENRKMDARIREGREQSILNSIFSAVQRAMESERTNSQNICALHGTKLSSITTILETTVDNLKSDLGTARVSIESHDTWIDIHKDHHEKIELELKAVKATVNKLVDDPGNKAKKVLQNVGAGAIPVVGYGLYMFLKTIFAGAHKGG